MRWNDRTIFLLLLQLMKFCCSVTYNITTANFLCNMTISMPRLLTLPAPWKCPTTAQIRSYDWCSPRWTGILCSGGIEQKIIQLDLSTQSLIGSIPSSIGSLTSLKYLYLQDNSVGHTIPSSLGRLSSLITLRLDSNSLEGTVPRTLTNLRFLTTLNLNDNYLTGTMPSGFASTTYNDDGAATTTSFNQLTYYPTSQPTGQPSRQPTSQPSKQNKMYFIWSERTQRIWFFSNDLLTAERMVEFFFRYYITIPTWKFASNSTIILFVFLIFRSSNLSVHLVRSAA